MSDQEGGALDERLTKLFEKVQDPFLEFAFDILAQERSRALEEGAEDAQQMLGAVASYLQKGAGDPPIAALTNICEDDMETIIRVANMRVYDIGEMFVLNRRIGHAIILRGVVQSINKAQIRGKRFERGDAIGCGTEHKGMFEALAPCVMFVVKPEHYNTYMGGDARRALLKEGEKKMAALPETDVASEESSVLTLSSSTGQGSSVTVVDSLSGGSEGQVNLGTCGSEEMAHDDLPLWGRLLPLDTNLKLPSCYIESPGARTTDDAISDVSSSGTRGGSRKRARPEEDDEDGLVDLTHDEYTMFEQREEELVATSPASEADESEDDMEEDEGDGERRERGRPRLLAPQWEPDEAKLRKMILQNIARRVGLPQGTIELIPIDPCPNPLYDQLASCAGRAPELIVFHGTGPVAIEHIKANSFKPYLKRGSESTFTYFATDARIADRYSKDRVATAPTVDREFCHIIVSKLKYARDSHIGTSGCTSGTITVPSCNINLVKPLYHARYPNTGRKLPLPPENKIQLEDNNGKLLKIALKKHLIVSKGKLKDFRYPS